MVTSVSERCTDFTLHATTDATTNATVSFGWVMRSGMIGTYSVVLRPRNYSMMLLRSGMYYTPYRYSDQVMRVWTTFLLKTRSWRLSASPAPATSATWAHVHVHVKGKESSWVVD